MIIDVSIKGAEAIESACEEAQWVLLRTQAEIQHLLTGPSAPASARPGRLSPPATPALPPGAA